MDVGTAALQHPRWSHRACAPCKKLLQRTHCMLFFLFFLSLVQYIFSNMCNVQTPSLSFVFEHVFKMIPAALCSRQWQRMHTSLLVTAQRAPWQSAILLECCGGAVRTPFWCDRAFSFQLLGVWHLHAMMAI